MDLTVRKEYMAIINSRREHKVKCVNRAITYCALLIISSVAFSDATDTTDAVPAVQHEPQHLEYLIRDIFIEQGYTERGIHYCDEMYVFFKPQAASANTRLAVLMLALYEANNTTIKFMARYPLKNEPGESTSFCIAERLLNDAKLHFVFESKPRNAGSLGDLMVSYEETIVDNIPKLLEHYTSDKSDIRRERNK